MMLHIEKVHPDGTMSRLYFADKSPVVLWNMLLSAKKNPNVGISFRTRLLTDCFTSASGEAVECDGDDKDEEHSNDPNKIGDFVIFLHHGLVL